VERKGVKETGKGTTASPAVYTLVDAAASITKGGVTKYYDTFEDAAKDATVPATATDLDTIVLLDNVTEDVTLAAKQQFNVQKGTFNLKVVPGHDTSVSPVVYYAVQETPGTVTNYKSVNAVAYITSGTGTTAKTTYYPSFAKAAADAFVPANSGTTVSDALTIVLISNPTDKYEADAGYLKVDVGTTGATIAASNLTLKEGMLATPEQISGTVYKVTVASAAAKILDNNQKPTYYTTVDKAVASGNNNLSHPIVLLAAGLTYGLAKDNVIYVDKNGHDDFTVTMTTPTDLDENSYAIVETPVGDVSVYSTAAGVAYTFVEATIPVGDYDEDTVTVYTLYDTFEKAVNDAGNGTKVIYLIADIPATSPYTMTEAEQVIRVYNIPNPELTTRTDLYALTVEPGDGIYVNETKEKLNNVETGVTRYTSEEAVPPFTRSLAQTAITAPGYTVKANLRMRFLLR
jgi:hypothetical protein